MTTPNRMETYWQEVAVFIKQEWPLISDSAIKKINGNFDLFLKYLQESYNQFPLTEATARNKIQNFLNTLEDQE